MKGLPLAYDKDMQEDKEPVFDAADTVNLCLEVFNGMIKTAKVNADAMMNASRKGFMNATDLADYYVRRGLPFREAYKICGKIVAYCAGLGIPLEELSLDEYRTFCSLTDEDVYDAIDLFNCMNRRSSIGGTSVKATEEQISYVRSKL
jgi:argininosuccinate lyase